MWATVTTMSTTNGIYIETDPIYCCLCSTCGRRRQSIKRQCFLACDCRCNLVTRPVHFFSIPFSSFAQSVRSVMERKPFEKQKSGRALSQRHPYQYLSSASRRTRLQGTGNKNLNIWNGNREVASLSRIQNMPNYGLQIHNNRRRLDQKQKKKIEWINNSDVVTTAATPATRTAIK